MSYALSHALQEAIYQRLSGDTALAAIVGPAIFDQVPAGAIPDTYVVLGSENVRDRSDMTGYGALHELTISVVAKAAGFVRAKDAAAAISDALVDAPLTLGRGRLVGLRFYKARAGRVGVADTRRIDLIFRARVSDE